MVWGILVVTMAAAAQQPAPVSEAELSQHLTTVRAQLVNPALDLGRRETLAMDMAATLDRAAQSASDPELRRKRWGEAIDLIDRFTRENPDAGLVRQLRFQAAVFRWAQAQTWVRAVAFEPANPRHRERAIALLDDAIERLRAISTIGDRTTLGENLRFRLAQALADRAELEPAGSEARRRREGEAMDLLEKPATELGLAGYWHLLKAELLLRTGKPAEARQAARRGPPGQTGASGGRDPRGPDPAADRREAIRRGPPGGRGLAYQRRRQGAVEGPDPPGPARPYAGGGGASTYRTRSSSGRSAG